MHKPSSGVFIQCGPHIVEAEKVSSVREETAFIFFARTVLYTKTENGEKLYAIVNRTLLTPLNEALVLAQRELTKRTGNNNPTAQEDVVFEVLPFFQWKNKEPVLSGDPEVERFRQDASCAEKPLGFRVIKRPLTAYEIS